MINILYLHAGAEMYGADKVLLDLILRLDKSKYTPFVILPNNGILVDEFKKNDINIEVVPYPIMRRKYFNFFGIISYFYNLIKFTSILSKFCTDKNINLIHSNTAATIEGGLIAKRLNIPHLWSIHEIIVNPKIIFKITSLLISKYSSLTTTVSKAVKNHLEASGYFNKNKIITVYNGVDDSRFTPDKDILYLRKEWNIPNKAKVIGMMGRVNSWKGQDDFLKAANIIMGKYYNVYTIFVGSAFTGEEWREEELKKHISESPYKDRIINVGYRTDSENIHNLCDIFVLPSTNPDPLPTVVLEAMSCGKPVVGYKHGGICEMVKDGYNGYFADVCDYNDLANKIEKILIDDYLRINMGKNSRERLLNEFSIEKYVNRYSEEYDKLINL